MKLEGAKVKPYLKKLLTRFCTQSIFRVIDLEVGLLAIEEGEQIK